MQASAWHAGPRLCSLKQRGVQLSAQAYSNNRGPEPSTSFAPDASRSGYRPPPADRAGAQVQNMRQQYPQAPPALLSRPADTGILQRSDMADKEVISTVTGSQLGVLSDLLVDAETMTVAALCLRQKTFSRKGIAGSCLDLAAMVQVGDVVLVNQDAPWPQTYAQTFEKLLGSQVYTYNGIPLGKVRNFSFNPDTGTVTAVQYDELGFPSIPESWVMLWEADVQSVQDLRDGRLTLKPRAQPFLLSNGAVGRFVSGALSVVGLREGGDALDMAGQTSEQQYQDWCRRHGDRYRQYYGKSPPETREEYEAFSLGYEAANGTRAPLQLPPPRNRSARDAFVADQAAGRSMEAVAVPNMARRDPRTRRQVYDAPARQSPYPPQQPPSSTPTYPSRRQDAYPLPQDSLRSAPQQQRPSYPAQPAQFEPRQGQYQPARPQPEQSRPPGSSAGNGQWGKAPSQSAADGSRQADGPADRAFEGSPEPSRQFAGSQPPQPARSQQQQQQGGYGSDPRQWESIGTRPYPAQGAWNGSSGEDRPQQRMPPPEAASENGKTASVPLIDRSPRPHQRRDVDGNFGEPPGSSQGQPAPAFREWAVDDQAQSWDPSGTGQAGATRPQVQSS